MDRRFSELIRGAATYGASFLSSLNGNLRATLLLNEYRDRRSHYADRARALGIRYSDELVPARTNERLRARGLSVEARAAGEVHTLAYFPLLGWHEQLVAPLRALGPLSHFDGLTTGLDYDALGKREPHTLASRRRMCEQFLLYATEVARRRKVDWVFTYASGLELLAETVDRVREITGAPVVGMCLDDKQSWDGGIFGEQGRGQLPLAARLDLAWSSSRVACDWYLVEGGNPVYMAEGCNPMVYAPGLGSPDLDVVFVGQAYGFRRNFVEQLRRLGLSVHAAGAGWPGGSIPADQVVRLFQRSRIILGLGGIGWSADLKNVKGRDFEAPAVGSAAYLTTFNPELTDHFDVGKEICCYSSHDECLEVAQRLLVDDVARKAIARLGRERCLRDHTWVHRFRRILEILGVHDEGFSGSQAVEP